MPKRFSTRQFLSLALLQLTFQLNQIRRTIRINYICSGFKINSNFIHLYNMMFKTTSKQIWRMIYETATFGKRKYHLDTCKMFQIIANKGLGTANDIDFKTNVLLNINLVNPFSLTAEDSSLSIHKNNVLLEDIGNKGLITLNRPEVRNALDMSMLRKIYSTLMKWKQKELIMIQAAGNRVFCAGGDLSQLLFSTYSERTFAQIFAGELTRVAYLISSCKLPYIAVMDKLAIGASAAITLHGKYRIVTENSVFVMPEAATGYFSDGGSLYILSRLIGELGMFMVLTARQLKGIDILYSGIATHYVHAAKLSEVKDRLLKSDPMSIEDILSEYQTNYSERQFSLAPYMEKMNHCFSASTIEEILSRLDIDGSEWARKTIEIMSSMSPTSLKVIHHACRKARHLDLLECLKMEFRLSCSFINSKSDFVKFGRSFVKNTAKPKWNPEYLKDVTRESVLKRFELLDPTAESELSKNFRNSE